MFCMNPPPSCHHTKNQTGLGWGEGLFQTVHYLNSPHTLLHSKVTICAVVLSCAFVKIILLIGEWGIVAWHPLPPTVTFFLRATPAINNDRSLRYPFSNIYVTITENYGGFKPPFEKEKTISHFFYFCLENKQTSSFCLDNENLHYIFTWQK